MIDLAYIIESADYRMYEACPEILTPDRKAYKPTVKIKYSKPKVLKGRCVRCGCVYQDVRRRKYCQPCSKEMKREYSRRNSEKMNSLLRETEGYHSEHLPCERWNGRRAQRDISDIAKQARAAGMSYGEFMALKRSGKI